MHSRVFATTKSSVCLFIKIYCMTVYIKCAIFYMNNDRCTKWRNLHMWRIKISEDHETIFFRQDTRSVRKRYEKELYKKYEELCTLKSYYLWCAIYINQQINWIKIFSSLKLHLELLHCPMLTSIFKPPLWQQNRIFSHQLTSAKKFNMLWTIERLPQKKHKSFNLRKS